MDEGRKKENNATGHRWTAIFLLRSLSSFHLNLDARAAAEAGSVLALLSLRRQRCSNVSLFWREGIWGMGHILRCCLRSPVCSKHCLRLAFGHGRNAWTVELPRHLWNETKKFNLKNCYPTRHNRTCSRGYARMINNAQGGMLQLPGVLSPSSPSSCL